MFPTALKRGVNLENEQALTTLARDEQYWLDLGPTHIRVTLNDLDVTEELRSMRVNENVKFIAASPGGIVSITQRNAPEWPDCWAVQLPVHAPSASRTSLLKEAPG